MRLLDERSYERERCRRRIVRAPDGSPVTSFVVVAARQAAEKLSKSDECLREDIAENMKCRCEVVPTNRQRVCVGVAAVCAARRNLKNFGEWTFVFRSNESHSTKLEGSKATRCGREKTPGTVRAQRSGGGGAPNDGRGVMPERGVETRMGWNEKWRAERSHGRADLRGGP